MISRTPRHTAHDDPADTEPTLRIDLHTHSTVSDGTLTPAELMRAAADARLDVVAITDHDTTGGWVEAAGALPPGLTLVRGAELSCRHDRTSLHLLAYLFDRHEASFRAARAYVRDSRRARGRRIVDKLRADGIPVTWQEISDDAAGGTVGRPHVARALIRHGLVSTVDEAFRPEWLGTRGRYWEPKAELDALEAVRLVRRAGGVPVFAHPLATKRGRTVGDEVIAAMAAAGLGGLEVDHPDQSAEERAHLRGLAAELGLFATGASDFHGSNKTIRLGANSTDTEAYEKLIGQATAVRPVAG